jgi:hypothetical protein
MTYDTQTVYTFKLITGEELICRIIDETNENFRITKPLTLVPSREGLGMTQSMFSATFDKDARLNKTAIVIGPSETRKDIADSYIEGTTGIKTVTKPSIITG